MSAGQFTTGSRTEREAIGADLRALRERLGWTQRDLATITGISQNSISRIEQAHADPLISTLMVLAHAAGRHVVLAAEHHLPLLNLTADEIDALRVAALSSALDHGSEETLRSALDKLTTTEETRDA